MNASVEPSEMWGGGAQHGPHRVELSSPLLAALGLGTTLSTECLFKMVYVREGGLWWTRQQFGSKILKKEKITC